MDVLYFLKDRTAFIRYFYENAAAPFNETKRKIENDEPPFDDPPYSEEAEPPYLEEWIQADSALEVLGRTCISLLSASLKLYFSYCENELRITWEEGERDKAFKKGFVKGYKYCFSEAIGINWVECSANFEVIEQVVLARNREQHPERIDTMSVSHSPKDWEKYPNPLFVHNFDKKLSLTPGMEMNYWFMPRIYASRDNLHEAIEEVEKMAEWLDERIREFRQRGYKRNEME